jgi:hypothetical protein
VQACTLFRFMPLLMLNLSEKLAENPLDESFK